MTDTLQDTLLVLPYYSEQQGSPAFHCRALLDPRSDTAITRHFANNIARTLDQAHNDASVRSKQGKSWQQKLVHDTKASFNGTERVSGFAERKPETRLRKEIDTVVRVLTDEQDEDWRLASDIPDNVLQVFYWFSKSGSETEMKLGVKHSKSYGDLREYMHVHQRNPELWPIDRIYWGDAVLDTLGMFLPPETRPTNPKKPSDHDLRHTVPSAIQEMLSEMQKSEKFSTWTIDFKSTDDKKPAPGLWHTSGPYWE